MDNAVKQIDWTAPGEPWQGEFVGEAHGAGVCLIFTHAEHAGEGAALHRHPYDETFIVRHGTVRFEVDGREVMAHAGQIVVVPAGVAHSFINAGPGPMEMIDIHASAAFVTEWLLGAAD